MILVPIERLQPQLHALAKGVFPKLGEPVNQHITVLLRRPGWRIPRRESSAVNPDCRSDDRAPPTNLGDNREQHLQLLYGVAALLCLEVPDKAIKVLAHAREDDA